MIICLWAGDIDLLLDGDSITDFWQQGEENKEMFDKYFGAIKTANFSISGDTTQGVQAIQHIVFSTTSLRNWPVIFSDCEARM